MLTAKEDLFLLFSHAIALAGAFRADQVVQHLLFPGERAEVELRAELIGQPLAELPDTLPFLPDFLDRFHIHTTKDNAGVGRSGAQAKRNFFAAVQTDPRHADGAFQGALLNHWCLERKNHAGILSQPDFPQRYSSTGRS